MAGLSKLRAVNIALENIGESPVSTLVGASGDAFVATAQSILEETSREVCAETWNFNKEVEYTLTPDVSGYITIADNMISVDGTYPTDYYTVRQGKLYDIDNQTFVFTDSVKADITWEFDFDDLPQHVRQYVAVRAARVFSRRSIGDPSGERLTEQDEGRARMSARRHDARNRDRTIFQDYGSGLHRLKNRRIY